MRYFNVQYDFREGINGPIRKKETEVAFDDIDPETTDQELKKMAEQQVDNRFYRSADYPLYGKFWKVTSVEEVRY